MVEQTGVPHSGATPDLNALQEQTQPAALKLLDDAALIGLMRELRAMKAAAGDAPGVQKSLAQAIRRAVAERRERQGGTGANSDALAARLAAKAVAASGKAEEKARKEAERAERKRVKEAERAERKAAKLAQKQAAGKLAQAKDKARDKKLAKLGGAKGAGKREKPEAVEPSIDAKRENKPGKDKPGKKAAGRVRPDGKQKPERAAAKIVAPAGDDEASS